jgi:HAD superfamily hydrolase (TIGR01459 family)
MKHVQALSELIELYDAFLVDQYGVLLDGAGAYAYARGALDELSARGKTVLLVSNSGKRAAENASRLSRFGFPRASYLDVVSSGEIAHAEIAARIGANLPRRGRVFIETSDEETHPLEGLDLVRVDRPEAADLVLIAGCRPWARSLDDYARLLAPAAARGVPAICSNPDITMLTASGPAFGAGFVAERYEQLGGDVEWIGKPFPAIYDAALKRLGAIDPARVLAIGDSPAHDILGARGAGVASALVRTGLYAQESEAELMARCASFGVAPDYLMPRFAF